MTLLARDEADIVDAWLEFHLNAGADFVVSQPTIAPSTEPRTCSSGTPRDGQLHLIREAGEDLRQNEWVTRMARMAATKFGADWVINSDADEFWWPRGASLNGVLAAVPPRYGTVSAFLRVVSPRPDGAGQFSERMTVRFSALAPINDPASLYKPIRKVIHRAASRDPGDAWESRTRRQPVRRRCADGSPSRCFTSRSVPLAQCEHKAQLQGNAWKHIDRTPDRVPRADVRGARARHDRRRTTRQQVVDRRRGRAMAYAKGRLVVDTRLRDALRQHRGAWRDAARLPDADARRRRDVRRRGGGRSARPTSSACSGASTCSSTGSRPSSSAFRIGCTARPSVP